MYFVYRFVDKTGSVIYVGKSKQDLQRRFSGHTHLPDECYRMVKKIEYIECPTEADMSIKEIYYINKYRNNPVCFNVLDVTALPTTIAFDDKWKMYKYALPSHFSNSINFKKGFSKDKEVRYNKDGTADKRKSPEVKGISSYVEGLTNTEVNLIINHLISEINNAENGDQEQIRFRNLVMFVLGVNLPLKPNDFLSLKYHNLFDEHDHTKPLSLKLGRFHKDETINIPLKEVVQKLLLTYTKRYGLSYANNANDDLFYSRKHQVLSSISWGRILQEAVIAVGISKNIGAESIRKTYGLNIFIHSPDKLKALVFLGELWGQARESQVIKYLNLTDDDIDFNYYLGETFSLGNVDISKIHCLQKQELPTTETLLPAKARKTVPKSISATKPKDKTQTKKFWTTEQKLEIVNKYLTESITMKDLSKQYDSIGYINESMISRWVNEYKRYGMLAFKKLR